MFSPIGSRFITDTLGQRVPLRQDPGGELGDEWFTMLHLVLMLAIGALAFALIASLVA